MTAETCLHQSPGQIMLFGKSVSETHMKKPAYLPVTSNLNYRYFHTGFLSLNPSLMKDSTLVGIYTMPTGK